MEVAPERMISSLVNTKMAAGASLSFSGALEAVVTVAAAREKARSYLQDPPLVR
jgi:hypothetical protein